MDSTTSSNDRNNIYAPGDFSIIDVINYSNIYFVLWFLAIYLIIFFILGIFNVQSGDVTNKLLASRTLDFFVFVFLLVYIVFNYRNWKNNTNGVDTIKFFELVNQKYKKPIWIADMAIHSFDGDNIDPDNIYNNLINLVTDEQEQADEYEALFTVLSYNMGNWFLGMSIDSYNNFPSNYTLPRHLNSPYSEDIRGKIAEGVVRKWYRQKM